MLGRFTVWVLFLRTVRWLQLIGFPPCLHVCLCTVCMCICMYAFICGGWYQEFSSIALQLDSLRQGVSVKPGADMATFASQLDPGPLSLCPSCLAHQVFTWVLGIQSQILLLAWHPSYMLSISPAQSVSFLSKTKPWARKRYPRLCRVPG